MKVNEVWTFYDGEKQYISGESGWYAAFTDDLGELYRSYQREFGRCVSRMYRDMAVAFSPAKAVACGWVFLKRERYTDRPETYLQETWVEYQREVDQHG